MGNIYYRKRLSNNKGFRLNLHGSRKGLSGSYSFYSKKEKGKPALTWNSKTGVTFSIHGTGLRWQQSQKGKGKTGKTREQISKDAAAKKAAYISGVESRKRDREAKRVAKERERKIAQQQRLEAQIEKKIDSLASKALVAEDKLYQKYYKKFSGKIEKLIQSAEECDAPEKFWSLTEKIEEINNELAFEKKETRYKISGVTEKYVRENWDQIKSSLSSQYQLTNTTLTNRGQLYLDLNELRDYFDEQINILNEISQEINNYYYEETCNRFIDIFINIKNKPLDSSAPETVFKIYDTEVLIDFLDPEKHRKVLFKNQNDKTSLIKINFIKNYFVHAIERIEFESSLDTIDKNIFVEKHYQLLEILINSNVEKIIDESECENINYAISIIAEVLSKNTQDKVEYYTGLGEKFFSLQKKSSKVFSAPIKFEPIFAVINFKLVYALEEIVDEIVSNEKNNETSQPIAQKVLSIETTNDNKINFFIQICISINKFSAHIDFNTIEPDEQKELILNSYADVRISIFNVYYELYIEPLIAHINTDNIQELDKDILILALPFIKLKRVVSEKFIIKLNDEREKNYKICNQFVDDFVDYLINIYAARIEELTDEVENVDAVNLIALAPIIIDLNGDLKLVTRQISSYMMKNFDKINNDIDKYIQEYCIKLKSNIQERKEIQDYNQDNIEKLDNSFENFKSIEKNYIPDLRIHQKKSLKNFEVSRKDKFLKLNHDKWLKIDPENTKEVNGDILLNLKKLKKLCKIAINDPTLNENQKISNKDKQVEADNGEILKFYYLAIYNELINLNYEKLTLKNKKFLSSFFSRTIYFQRKDMKTYYHPVIRILMISGYSYLALVIAALLLFQPEKPKPISNTQQSSKIILDKKNTIDESKTIVKEYKEKAKKKQNNNKKEINNTLNKKSSKKPKIVFKTIEYDDNTIYSGGVDKNGIYQGYGKIRKNSKLVYEGEFKDGKFHGRGKVTDAKGSIYEGEFKDGKFHGRGKVTDAKGSIYEGEFKDGKFHDNDDTKDNIIPKASKKTKTIKEKLLREIFGEKVSDVTDTSLKVSSNFFYKNIYKNKNSWRENSYQGTQSKGLPMGKGREYFKDGSTYIGFYVNGIKLGEGKFTWNNGDYYIGRFENNMPNGNGQCFIAKSKENFSCSFKNGVVVK
jgi:hypothetical protein